MKCEACGAEWTVPASVIAPMEKCPFCGESLLPSTRSLKAALAAIAASYGRDALRHEKAALSLLRERAPQLKREALRLRLLYGAGGATLFDAIAAPEDAQAAALNNLASRLAQDYWLTPNGAKRLCDDFWSALTLTSVPEAAALPASVASMLSLPEDREVGAALACGRSSYGRLSVEDWKDLVEISAGEEYTLGLRVDGTVVICGNLSDGRGEVTKWRDIAAVSAGCQHIIGLKRDGTAVACGDGSYGRCDVTGWRDLVAVSAGEYFAAGLRADGTAIASGAYVDNLSDWRDIVAISAGSQHVVGLRRDGRVVTRGANGYGQCEVRQWRDIAQVSAGKTFTLGLRRDGTVVGCGQECAGLGARDWCGMAAVAAGNDYAAGLRRDGEVLACGSISGIVAMAAIRDWRGVFALSAGYNHLVALKREE